MTARDVIHATVVVTLCISISYATLSIAVPAVIAVDIGLFMKSECLPSKQVATSRDYTECFYLVLLATIKYKNCAQKNVI